jgi:hypothetical protein
MNNKLFEAIYAIRNSGSGIENQYNTYLESPLDNSEKEQHALYEKIYQTAGRNELFEKIYFECRLKPLVEQVLREMSTSHSTGGLSGQKFAQIVINNEKPILELLKLATSEVSKNSPIEPEIENKTEKTVTQKKFFGLLNKQTPKQVTQKQKINDISDEKKRNQEKEKWINEAVSSFIEIVSKKRVLNNDDITTIRDYFTNLSSQQPLIGRQDDGQTWNNQFGTTRNPGLPSSNLNST